MPISKETESDELLIPHVEHNGGTVAPQPIFDLKPVSCEPPKPGVPPPDDTVLMGAGAEDWQVRAQYQYRHLVDPIEELSQNLDLSDKMMDWTVTPRFGQCPGLHQSY